MTDVDIAISRTEPIFDERGGVREVEALYRDAIAAATVNYTLGLKLGREMVRRPARGTLNKISKRLARRGLATVVFLRIVPVAPYSIVNLALGASHISFRDYLIGTFLGMLPGVATISVFGENVRQVPKHPDRQSIAIPVGILPAVLVVWTLIRKHFVGE